MYDRDLARIYVAIGSPGLVQSFDANRPRLLETVETEEGAHTIGWDPALKQLIVNGAVGEFQYAYGQYAQWSAVLSDEAYTDHTNVDVRDFSEHNFGDLNTINSTTYEYVQRARQSGDDATDRLKTLLGTGASSDINVATVLAYAGYSYVLLGEGWCESPVNLSAPLPSDSLLRRAIARFDEAIVVATAARQGTTTAAAQDLIYMSQVGAARAALKVGDLTLARSELRDTALYAPTGVVATLPASTIIMFQRRNAPPK